MRARQLVERWDAGEPTFGAWCSIPQPMVVEIMGQAGYSWICVDLQHGMGDYGHAAALFQSISLTGAVPFVRVATQEPWAIMRALDLGAKGVIIPLVRTADDAAAAVRACRYPPHGIRSYGPVRVASPTGANPAEADADVICLPMIETQEAIDNLEDICAVPGVAGVYIGPKDLSLAVGLSPGQELEEIIADICRRARAVGCAPGIHTRGGKGARAYADAGFLWAAVATDREFLFNASVSELVAATGTAEPQLPVIAEPLLRTTTSYVATGK